jgi:hypothetical protein
MCSDDVRTINTIFKFKTSISLTIVLAEDGIVALSNQSFRRVICALQKRIRY